MSLAGDAFIDYSALRALVVDQGAVFRLQLS